MNNSKLQPKPVTIIPYARHYIDKDDIEAVVSILKNGWLTQGPKVKEFEEALCRYTGAKYAIAVSSGTAALHLSMLALNIGKKDEIITSPVTFSATANCAVYVGAFPKFVDIDLKTYHLDIDKLEEYLKKPTNRKNVKAVLPVHLAGTVADIVKIRSICNKYGIKVIEDAAHALGASYKSGGKWYKVGCCRHSDITIFSFHPIKHITTGEGGAILTNNKKIYEKAKQLRHHGIVKNSAKFGWFYDISQIGYNYRLTDFQCALGISQLQKLDKFVQKRRKLVQFYNLRLKEVKSIILPYERPDTCASYHLYVVRVKSNLRSKLYNYLKTKNILTQVNYIPVHLFSYYRKALGYKREDFPAAEKYYKEALSLPLYYKLDRKSQNYIVETIKKFFEK